MNTVDVKSDTYIDYGVKYNDRDPKFKVVDHVRTSKYKYIFAKDCTSNLPEQLVLIKKVKHTAPWTCVIDDLNDEEIVGTF